VRKAHETTLPSRPQELSGLGAFLLRLRLRLRLRRPASASFA
jgi:hypothetical protein